jgi:hypothetical protein
MSTQRYTVTPYSIEAILNWVKSGEIAIPEIQRPFVWDATKVRNLLDSLYAGFPVGYLIAWRNPSVRLKDGSKSSGKRILIDGQQRVTALMAAILGMEVLTKNYEAVRIRIAFHPIEERFEVLNAAIRKGSGWIHDVADIFAPDAKMLQRTREYVTANPDADEDRVFAALERLKKIVNNHVGIIELAEDLDIETVTEIFIRVNSAGAALSQADFAMSKIASNATYGGNQLRKAIDYFCHLAVSPEMTARIEKNDRPFAESEYFRKMKWLADSNDDIYDPSYTDMLRVAFTSEFGRGKLQDLVALLSGRNFETKQFEDVIAEESFDRLRTAVFNFINETHFKRFVMILGSAGFIANSLITGQNAVNFAYVVYLRGRAEKLPADELERLVRRWFVASVLTGRYSGNPETTFDYDIRQIASLGIRGFIEDQLAANLGETFWTTLLPRELETSSANNPQWLVFQAAQVKQGDRGFVSRDITVRDLILNRSDVHHLFPKDYLKKQGLGKTAYNQVANYVIAQSEINIAIGNKAPDIYMREVVEQCNGGARKYGGITDLDQLKANFAEHAIPERLLFNGEGEYETFLSERRQLMAAKVRQYFERL